MTAEGVYNDIPDNANVLIAKTGNVVIYMSDIRVGLVT